MNPTDKIINIIRVLKEEGMVANAPGTQGGYGGDAPAEGPRAGFDPVMKKTTRRKNTIGLWASSLKKKKK